MSILASSLAGALFAVGINMSVAGTTPALTAETQEIPGLVCPMTIGAMERRTYSRTKTEAIGECSYRGPNDFAAAIQVYEPGRAEGVIDSISRVYDETGITHVGKTAKLLNTVWGAAIGRGQHYVLSDDGTPGAHEQLWRIELADRDLFIWMQFSGPENQAEALQFLEQAARSVTPSAGTLRRPIGG